jgi:hypothetical protein
MKAELPEPVLQRGAENVASAETEAPVTAPCASVQKKIREKVALSPNVPYFSFLMSDVLHSCERMNLVTP